MSTKPTYTKNSVIRVQQHPDPNAESIGLSQHGMSKLPGTFHVIQPRIDSDGRYVTGIDENASYLAMEFSGEELVKRRALIQKTRERLQMQLGIADLSATSSYWDNYFVDLSTSPILDLKQAAHELKWYVLKANKVIMPDSTFKNTPEFWDSKFVAYEPEFEATNKNVDRVIIDGAIATVLNLKNNYNKMLAISRLLLGPSINNEMGAEVLYDRLRTWLDTKPKENSVAITRLNDRDLHELETEVNIQNALNFGVIPFRNGQYYYGKDNVGRSTDQVVEFLMNPENHHIYDAMLSELENKLKLAKV